MFTDYPAGEIYLTGEDPHRQQQMKFKSPPSMVLPLQMWMPPEQEINVSPATPIAAAVDGSSGFTSPEEDRDLTPGLVDRMLGTEKKKRSIKKRKRGLRFCERSKRKKTTFSWTLPTGWVTEKCVRTQGVHVGRVDKYYVDPDTGVKFKSRPAVERYLWELEEEKLPLKMLGFRKDKISHQKKRAAVERNSGSKSRTSSSELSDGSIIDKCARTSGNSAGNADKMLGIGKKDRSIKKKKRKMKFHKRVMRKETSFSLTLPIGWVIEECVRTHGAHAGRVDKYYVDPDTGVKFRSRPAVERYLLELEEEKVPLKVLGFHKKDKISQERKMATVEGNTGVRSRTSSLELSDGSIIEKCAGASGGSARKVDKMLGFQKNKVLHQREMAIVDGNSETRISSFELPEDWIIEKCVRSSGKSAGTVDKYYLEPGTMRRYRSLASVQRRLAELDGSPPSFSGSKSDKFIGMSGVGKKGTLVYKRRLATGSGATITKMSSSELPEGWVVEEHPRSSGRFAGVVDKYYIEPGTMRKFRSLISAQRHLAEGDCSWLTLQLSNQDNQHLAERDCSLLTLQQSYQEDLPMQSQDLLPWGEKLADPKEKTPPLDSPKSPMKIKWVFSGSGGGDTWNPYVDESMVADSVKQRWNDSFISSFDLL